MATKSFRPTESQVSAAMAVFQCMAAVDVVKPIVLAYRSKVLREIGWGHIEPSGIYDLPDSVFDEYIRRCNEERIAAKLHVDNPDHCPLLVAENLLRLAQRVLIDEMEPVSGVSFDQIFRSKDALKRYDEFVELNLRLLAPYCKGRM